jgi:hypothetical protein
MQLRTTLACSKPGATFQCYTLPRTDHANLSRYIALGAFDERTTAESKDSPLEPVDIPVAFLIAELSQLDHALVR